MIRTVVKVAKRPAAAAAWWGAWWAWRNRPIVQQWTRFARDAVRERRAVPDVLKEARVRGVFAMNPALRHSAEVHVSSVSHGVVHLVGLPGGVDTNRAATLAARVPGVASVEVHDKVVVADGDVSSLGSVSIG